MVPFMFKDTKVVVLEGELPYIGESIDEMRSVEAGVSEAINCHLHKFDIP